MSDSKKRVLIVGATGLVGRQISPLLADRDDIAVHALVRRGDNDMPSDYQVADPSAWPEAIAEWKPHVFVSALGITLKKAGGNKAAFRAVDYQLVLDCAAAAHAAGAGHAIIVTAVGASARSPNLYQQTKGEVEESVTALGFDRLDIVRPGLLRGERVDDPRIVEGLMLALAPITDSLLPRGWSRYGSIDSADVARAIAQLALGNEDDAHDSDRHVHHNDSLLALAAQMTAKTG
ncbi:NAD(P)H-binding protein [Alterisphingorhabdus coralli]|uniref:NAD(P)H-binding protein n=1 Tax=Alterisphingorhabdus coralli TaxID=3071408 RepID=A0AA97F4K7_9SPHN|nr:NAD(P)H-binding protein [Parasphingorhabdus sp. SCSIO 66989]WOE74199.1 NAD(P)H-binding protein [Parasphingorhabdus sp. SCSIO 66989]